MFSESLSKKNFFTLQQEDETPSSMTFYSPNSPKVFFPNENNCNYKYSDHSSNIDQEISQFAEREIINGFGSKSENYENMGISIGEEEEDDKRYKISNFNEILKKISQPKIFCNSNNSSIKKTSSNKTNSKEYESQNQNQQESQKSYYNNNNNKSKIFSIKKVPKNFIIDLDSDNDINLFEDLSIEINKREDYQRIKKNLGRKRKRISQEKWDNISVPKEKHFMLDRKKHRIVFQRKHLKVIYSVVHLKFPINFQRCFDKIKEHVGDKTKENFGKRKSFHFVEVNGREEIMLLKEKKSILKNEKYNSRKINGK